MEGLGCKSFQWALADTSSTTSPVLSCCKAGWVEGSFAAVLSVCTHAAKRCVRARDFRAREASAAAGPMSAAVSCSAFETLVRFCATLTLLPSCNSDDLTCCPMRHKALVSTGAPDEASRTCTTVSATSTTTSAGRTNYQCHSHADLLVIDVCQALSCSLARPVPR